MGQVFSLSMKFEEVVCCSCGTPFASTDYFFGERRKDHAWFYCPNGHAQQFQAQSEADKLRVELAAERQRKESALARLNVAEQEKDKALRSVARAKSDQKRTHKRIAAGVCPCCNRTFKQLAAHMQTKHPEYAK